MDMRVDGEHPRVHGVHHDAFGDLVGNPGQTDEIIVDFFFVFASQWFQIACAKVAFDLE